MKLITSLILFSFLVNSNGVEAHEPTGIEALKQLSFPSRYELVESEHSVCWPGPFKIEIEEHVARFRSGSGESLFEFSRFGEGPITTTKDDRTEVSVTAMSESLIRTVKADYLSQGFRWQLESSLAFKFLGQNLNKDGKRIVDRILLIETTIQGLVGDKEVQAQSAVCEYRLPPKR